MNQKIKVPGIDYLINGEIVEIQQDMGHGEYAAIDVHKVHIKMIAEEMRITEPTPASMNEIVKLELMELLAAAFEHWDDVGNNKHADLDTLTQARTLYQKTLSVCRIAGCNVDERNDDGVTSALPTQSKVDSVSAHDNLNEASVSNQHSLLEV